jgi:hypothetical protein
MTYQEKYRNTLFQFVSGIPRRDYFSEVAPVQWTFPYYCAYRLKNQNNLAVAALERDFKSDLQWLQSKNQNLPKEVKQYVKSLEVRCYSN